MNNCIFCKIIGGEIPSERFYEDDRMIIVKDIEPKAKLHYLAIPKRHYKLLREMTDSDREDLGYILQTVAEQAENLGLKNGYRLVINQGDDAGQTVFHLHIHILGGQTMDFPQL
ncbi:MAG: histidine triad nucleotide-binding protein [Clostridia bacterium]|nr:histidine triad nucleotide-binding protein [Clostridia bacterium]